MRLAIGVPLVLLASCSLITEFEREKLPSLYTDASPEADVDSGADGATCGEGCGPGLFCCEDGLCGECCDDSHCGGCVGEATPCDRISTYGECETQLSCVPGGTCGPEDTPAACSQLSNQRTSCLACGCNFQTYGGNCLNSPPPFDCDLISPENCETCGCSLSLVCTGDVIDCDQLEESECSVQLGCTWGYCNMVMHTCGER